MQNLDSHSEGSDQEQHDKRSEEDETQYMNALDPSIQAEEDDKKEDLDVTQSQEGFSEKIIREFQFIYIAKYCLDYRQPLEALAYQYGCDLSFRKNSFTISCKNKTQLDKWTICKELIVQEFDKIIHKKVQDKEKRFRLLYSSEVNKFAMEKGIYFCQFNSEIYVHSNRYSMEELEKQKQQICKYCNIFTVCFNKKKNMQTIDFQIAKFYRTVLEEYYKERFAKNNMIVQVNKLDRSFYILGKPGATPKFMMEAKKTIKNLIEGITIVAFKNITLDLKTQIKLKSYLKKISTYPITYAKISQTVVVLISKDNILKELLKKKQKIIQKLPINQNTSIGIYMPFCYSREDKRQQIYKICKEEGYDFWTNWGVRYFRPMIANQEDVKNQAEIIELIIRIIGGFIDVKESHEVMKENDKPTNEADVKKKKQLEEQSKYAYILKNLPKDSVEISKALRRDIMEDEVLMMKRYNVIYNLLEGDEIGPYYIDQGQYDRGVDKGQIRLIEREQLKKGQFFEVYLKVVPQCAEDKTLPEIEEMFLDELKRLKKAAKLDKEEGRSLDNQRKIAHMIKKLLNVF